MYRTAFDVFVTCKMHRGSLHNTLPVHFFQYSLWCISFVLLSVFSKRIIAENTSIWHKDLSSSLSSSSLLLPLYSVFTIIYLKQTVFLGYIVLQLFCVYNLCFLSWYFTHELCFVLLPHHHQFKSQWFLYLLIHIHTHTHMLTYIYMR